MSKLRVGLIFGGRSGEHEVSLASAQGILKAIDRTKYDVVPIGITKAGEWLTGGDPHQHLLDEAAGHPVLPQQLSSMRAIATLTAWAAESGPVDVIFPVLHGPFGEDGTIQGLLELAGLPYVGSGVTASAAVMDKALSKDILAANNIPIVKHVMFLRKQWQLNQQAVIAACEDALTYPMFVKPANLGSSVGIHKAKNQAELAAGLVDAARYDRKLVVEQGIDAREIEISVLGNDDPIVSVPGEILPSREFYSYAAKYLDNSSKLLIPAPLDSEQTAHIQDLAKQAYIALDCAGLARCDMLLDKHTGDVYINELNTMPGFTPISMYPKLWEASGIAYAELIDRLIALALERAGDKQQSQTTFDVSTAD